MAESNQELSNYNFLVTTTKTKHQIGSRICIRYQVISRNIHVSHFVNHEHVLTVYIWKFNNATIKTVHENVYVTANVTN